MEQHQQVIETRRQQAAQRMGVDVSTVETRRIELSQLREAGLLIDIDVHGTSMFQARTTYAELGMGADDVRTERLRRGSKDLFPKHAKQLRSLEARARQNLSAHSFRVAAFGNWSWMPWTAYSEFKERHEAIVAEMDAVKADILAEYDGVAEANRAYFEQVAGRAWKDMLAEYAPGDHVMIRTTNGAAFDSQTGYDLFVEHVVQRALAKMPLPEEIDAIVRIDYRTSILYAEHEIAQAHAEMAQATAAEAEARQRTTQADADAFVAASKAQAEIDAYKQAEIEHARQQLSQMGSPIDDALNALRANLYDAVKTLLAGIDKNGGFRGQASTKAAELYRYWRRLNGNLLQDTELDASLAALDQKMSGYRASKEGREAKVTDITATLSQIAALTNEQARKIRKSAPSRAAALEL